MLGPLGPYLTHHLTVLQEVNFGSGFCDEMYHRTHEEKGQQNPIPLQSKLTSATLVTNSHRGGTFFRSASGGPKTLINFDLIGDGDLKKSILIVCDGTFHRRNRYA